MSANLYTVTFNKNWEEELRMEGYNRKENKEFWDELIAYFFSVHTGYNTT
jgi:hypothetical protein